MNGIGQFETLLSVNKTRHLQGGSSGLAEMSAQVSPVCVFSIENAGQRVSLPAVFVFWGREKGDSMYYLTAEAAFDSAHFLADYEGKCANLHGHRWRIVAKVSGARLQEFGDKEGMVLDFSDLKRELRGLADGMDHCLIYQKGTLRMETLDAFEMEGFEVAAVPFRPTAENLAKHFYDEMAAMGLPICAMSVYETPDNCATFEKEPKP